MSRIFYGCQTYPWKMNQEKFAGDLPHIASVTAQAGFQGLEAEICMLGDYFNDPQRTREVLEENGLELAALVLHQPWCGEEETPEEAALSDRAIDFLTHFPRARLMVSHHAGKDPRPEGAALLQRRKNLIRCMSSVADRAAERGIVTGYHPNSARNSLFRTREDYDVLFELLEETDVGYIPDIGHIVNGGMDALEILNLSRHKIRHVHFKDRIAQDQWAVMGEGCIDYPAIIRYLEQTGYGGWIMVEDESPKALTDSDAVVRADGAYITPYKCAD